MKIKGKVLKINEINQNGNYISLDVAKKSIETLKNSPTKPSNNGICMVYQGKLSGLSVPSLIDVIGVVTDLYVDTDESGTYLWAKADILKTHYGSIFEEMLDNNFNLKFAVDAYFKDHYVNYDDFVNNREVNDSIKVESDENETLGVEICDDCDDEICYDEACDDKVYDDCDAVECDDEVCDDCDAVECGDEVCDNENKLKEPPFSSVCVIDNMDIMGLTIMMSNISNKDTTDYYIQKIVE